MKRLPRWLQLTAVLLLVVIGIAWLTWSSIVRAEVAALLEPVWGGPATLGGAQWFFTDTVVLKDVVAPDAASGRPMIEVDRIELRFERVPIVSDRGKLVAADFLGGTLAWQGRRVCTVAAVRYRRDADQGRRLVIEGVDGTFALAHAADWVDVIGRIAGAPGIAGDGTGPWNPMREIRAVQSRLAVTFALGEGAAQTLQLETFNCSLHSTAPKVIAIDSLTTNVLGGVLRASGSVDWRQQAIDWHAQANLEHLDLGSAGAALAWLPDSAAGTVSAFLDVGTAGNGELAGAGWVQGSKVAIWEQPVAKLVVGELGLQPARGDVLDEVRSKLLIDRGRLWLEQLIAIGSPVNLFGNGSIRLDGSDVAIGLVPRFRPQQLKDIELEHDGPGDVLFDIVKGSLVEVRVDGSLGGVDVFVQPLPLVTEPLRRFLDLLR